MAKLYVVATPIGNLGDMSTRAIEALKTADLIAAEDTRVTKKLTVHFQIDTPLTSCHQHNEEGKSQHIVKRMLEEDISVALTTDAGTPAISDPGYALVKAAEEAGIEVLAIPGACAMAAALSISGMDTREFAFYGFLPREKKALKEKLMSMARGVPIAVVHESPYRVLELMEAIQITLPETRVSVSCDLTKLHELTLRGNVGEVLETMQANPKVEKGEYCIVLDFHQVLLEEEVPKADVSLEAQLFEELLKGVSLRDAQSGLTEQGAKKNAVYQAALRVKAFLEQGLEG